jgi:hypothetical protein
MLQWFVLLEVTGPSLALNGEGLKSPRRDDIHWDLHGTETVVDSMHAWKNMEPNTIDISLTWKEQSPCSSNSHWVGLVIHCWVFTTFLQTITKFLKWNYLKWTHVPCSFGFELLEAEMTAIWVRKPWNRNGLNIVILESLQPYICVYIHTPQYWKKQTHTYVCIYTCICKLGLWNLYIVILYLFS